VKDKTKGAAEQAYNTATEFPSDAAEMAGTLFSLTTYCSSPTYDAQESQPSAFLRAQRSNADAIRQLVACRLLVYASTTDGSSWTEHASYRSFLSAQAAATTTHVHAPRRALRVPASSGRSSRPGRATPPARLLTPLQARLALGSVPPVVLLCTGSPSGVV
jgi:hypothetical protein